MYMSISNFSISDISTIRRDANHALKKNQPVFYKLLEPIVIFTKAKLLLLKLIHSFAREVLLVKKLEIEETKTT